MIVLPVGARSQRATGAPPLNPESAVIFLSSLVHLKETHSRIHGPAHRGSLPVVLRWQFRRLQPRDRSNIGIGSRQSMSATMAVFHWSGHCWTMNL